MESWHYLSYLNIFIQMYLETGSKFLQLHIIDLCGCWRTFPSPPLPWFFSFRQKAEDQKSDVQAMLYVFGLIPSTHIHSSTHRRSLFPNCDTAEHLHRVPLPSSDSSEPCLCPCSPLSPRSQQAQIYLQCTALLTLLTTQGHVLFWRVMSLEFSSHLFCIPREG